MSAEKNIVLGVTGSIAAHKAADLASLPLLKTYTQERMSSFDQTGANADGAAVTVGTG